MIRWLVISLLWFSEIQALAAAPPEVLTCPSNGTAYNCQVCNCYHESSGEPQEGRIAVAKTVLSRVAAAQASISRNQRPDFPNSVCGVIFQPSQFSWTPGNNTISAKTAEQKTALRECRAAVNVAQTEGANGLIYFYNPRKVTPGWLRLTSSCGRVGDHVFLVPRGKKCPPKLGSNATPAPQRPRGGGQTR
jgi:N-acetylmuramoyl-L-alanine amidase